MAILTFHDLYTNGGHPIKYSSEVWCEVNEIYIIKFELEKQTNIYHMYLLVLENFGRATKKNRCVFLDLLYVFNTMNVLTSCFFDLCLYEEFLVYVFGLRDNDVDVPYYVYVS